MSAARSTPTPTGSRTRPWTWKGKRQKAKCGDRRSEACGASRSWPWPVMRRRLTDLQRPEIRGPASESVVHVRQNHAAIDGGRRRPQPEVELLGLVDLLHRPRILGVETRHPHEDVVIHEHAV